MRRRRQFLCGAAAVLVVAYVHDNDAVAGPTAESNGSPEESFPNLGHHIGVTLLRAARDIYPHDSIPDSLYLQALVPYDTAAAKNDALRRLLTDGVADLNESANRLARCDYAELKDESQRIEALQQQEHGALFRRLQTDLLYTLYNDKSVWPLLGYEGSSWEKGGYLHRGFDDIDWLGR